MSLVKYNSYLIIYLVNKEDIVSDQCICQCKTIWFIVQSTIFKIITGHDCSTHHFSCVCVYIQLWITEK